MNPEVAKIILNAPAWAKYALATVNVPHRLLYAENTSYLEKVMSGPTLHPPRKVGELNRVMWDERLALFIRCKE